LAPVMVAATDAELNVHVVATPVVPATYVYAESSSTPFCSIYEYALMGFPPLHPSSTAVSQSTICSVDRIV